MSWVMASMATLGALKGGANEKKNERLNKFRAEALRYQPWTKMADPGMADLPGVFDSALQGVATGAMAKNLMGKDPSTLGTGMETGQNIGGMVGAASSPMPPMSAMPKPPTLFNEDLMAQEMGLKDLNRFNPYSQMPVR